MITLKKLLLLAALFTGLHAGAQTMVESGPNVYSPHMQVIDSRLKMYFGGWQDQDQTHDKIYRSDCPTADHCDFEQAVVFLESGAWTDRPAGTVHVNDPSIVSMGDYLIMYMTVCRDAAKCVTDTSVNEIDYSVSWASDGLHWTSPVPLLLNAWSPSAVRKPDGSVWLYANTAGDGMLFYMSLGPSGAEPSARMPVNVGANIGYQNIEVRYYAAFAQYVMVGERTGLGVIDALLSRDGVSFSMVWQSIATPIGDWSYVRTPAMYPNNVCFLYAAASKESWYAEGNKIFVKSLCQGSL